MVCLAGRPVAPHVSRALKKNIGNLALSKVFRIGSRRAMPSSSKTSPTNWDARLQSVNNCNRAYTIRRMCAYMTLLVRVTLTQRLAQTQRRMDQAYQDKLDGKISEEFWMRKSGEWQAEENQIRASMQGLETARPERLLDAARILELANKAYFLYVKQNHTERAKLLKMVLSNCGIDAVSLYPTYRKPFDLIFQKVKTEEWCARYDSNSTRLASKLAREKWGLGRIFGQHEKMLANVFINPSCPSAKLSCFLDRGMNAQIRIRTMRYIIAEKP
jgi:hypothetical protein